MSGFNVAIQCLASSHKLCVLGVVGDLGDRSYDRQGASKTLRKFSTLPSPAVQVKDQVREISRFEPFEDGLDGSPLLGHEQDGLPSCECGRNEVGDRLALAGSRRTPDDQVLPVDDRVNRVVLARIRVEDEELIRRRGPVRVVEGDLGLGVLSVQSRAGFGIAGNRCDDVVLDECVLGGFEILDHRQLGVREVPKDDSVGDAETRDPIGSIAEPLVGRAEFPARIDDTIDRVEELVLVERSPELGREKVEQRRVDLHLA